MLSTGLVSCDTIIGFFYVLLTIFSGFRCCCDLSRWTKAWIWIWWLCHILRSTGTNKTTAFFFLPSSFHPSLPFFHASFLASFHLSFGSSSLLTLQEFYKILGICEVHYKTAHTARSWVIKALDVFLDSLSEDPERLLQKILGYSFWLAYIELTMS